MEILSSFDEESFHLKELVAYLAEKSKRLGIVKRKRKSDKPSPLVFIGPLTAS